ncbi:uncharacterized protein LOC131624543 [Vicia villosa]|uniref:uncharacterized protein LOC131624543 n=1 Tax=Vicia villosa TaxID=3911 RepID=UPI00273CD54D|nr:uncharacterized protein LOC131624543 [Vicia villosa]
MCLKVKGRWDFVLKEKLKLLKDKLKRWNRDVFGKTNLDIEEDVNDINLADERMKWLKEGDTNSGFFHKVMKQRRLHNHIGPILTSGGMVELVEDVREEVFKHFGNKFVEPEVTRPVLDGVQFNTLNFINFFNYFFLGRPISKVITSSFLTLVPKSNNLIGLDDYRPIFLVGFLYKVVAKLLSGRIKGVLNSIISPCQSAFVPGRQLLDGVVVANEVVDYARKEYKNCVLFKVDFEKAYDKVSWSFLRFMLKRMGFGEKWMKWMELLVFNSNMSVLANGSPTKEFKVSRGLRQGDPLSPFLFVLVAEGLTGLVRKSIEVGEFQSFNINGSCPVYILQFADDTLIVGEGNWKHVWAMRVVLRAFELVSGLGINYHKSKLIGINSNLHFLEAVSHFLSCKVEDSNFYFLGIPIGFNPRKEATWYPLLSKLKNRLDGWTNRFLNMGGRITLLKSVLSSLSIFWMSFYKLPSKVVKRINGIQSKFLWGGVEERRRIHWIKWEDVTLPLNKGGLGVKNIILFNLALLNKWRWQILKGANSLWHKVLHVRYGDLSLKMCGGGEEKKVFSRCSFWWKNLIKIIPLSSFDPFIAHCRFSIHNGFSTPFWEAKWLEGCTLKEDFPNLYKISCLKKVSMTAMGGWVEGEWKWGDFGLCDMGVEEMILGEEAVALKGRVEAFRGWLEGKDNVVWEKSLNSEFSVASCYNFYDNIHIPFGPPNRNDVAFGLLWRLEVPMKIMAFGWRLFHDRLPMKDLLVLQGIFIPFDDLKCSFCGYCVESCSHLCFSCSVVKKIWSEIAFWVGKEDRVDKECMSNFMDWHSFFYSKKVKERKLGVVWLAITWSLWLIRNRSSFRKENWNVNNTVWNIKHLMNDGNNSLNLNLSVFDGNNWNPWMIRMGVLFGAQYVLVLVNDCYTHVVADATKAQINVQQKTKKKDHKVLFYIHQCVDANVFEKISDLTTTKAAWDTLVRCYGGDASMKKVEL